MKKRNNINLKTANLIKIGIVLLLAVVFFFVIRKPEQTEKPQTISLMEAAKEAKDSRQDQSLDSISVSENEQYSDPGHVAMYLHRFGHLPSNYITKTQAKKRGWDQDAGNLWEVLPGMSIGGGPFTNAEQKLPEKDGREYKECDVNYNGGARGDDRIVYSNDGLIYFTGDHYNTFQLIYGEP